MKLILVTCLVAVLGAQAQYYYKDPYSYNYNPYQNNYQKNQHQKHYENHNPYQNNYQNQHQSHYENPYYNDVKIRRYENENLGNGRYRFAYDQTDGQMREEYGEIRNEGQDAEYLAVKGSYAWMDPNGVPYRVNYAADENGYQPEIEEGPGGGVPPAVVASLLG